MDRTPGGVVKFLPTTKLHPQPDIKPCKEKAEGNKRTETHDCEWSALNTELYLGYRTCALSCIKITRY